MMDVMAKIVLSVDAILYLLLSIHDGLNNLNVVWELQGCGIA